MPAAKSSATSRSNCRHGIKALHFRGTPHCQHLLGTINDFGGCADLMLGKVRDRRENGFKCYPISSIETVEVYRAQIAHPSWSSCKVGDAQKVFLGFRVKGGKRTEKKWRITTTVNRSALHCKATNVLAQDKKHAFIFFSVACYEFVPVFSGSLTRSMSDSARKERKK